MIRDLDDAFARGDAAAVLALFDPQIRWQEADGGETIVALGRYTGRFRGTGQVVDAQFAYATAHSAVV